MPLWLGMSPVEVPAPGAWGESRRRADGDSGPSTTPRRSAVSRAPTVSDKQAALDMLERHRPRSRAVAKATRTGVEVEGASNRRHQARGILRRSILAGAAQASMGWAGHGVGCVLGPSVPLGSPPAPNAARGKSRREDELQGKLVGPRGNCDHPSSHCLAAAFRRIPRAAALHSPRMVELDTEDVAWAMRVTCSQYPAADIRIMPITLSTPGENQSSFPGLNRMKPLRTSALPMPLPMVCMAHAGSTESVARRISP